MNPFVLEYLGETVDVLWDCASLCDSSLLPDLLDVLCILASVVTRNRKTGEEVEVSIVNRTPLSLIQKESVDVSTTNHSRVPSTSNKLHSAHLSVHSVVLPSLYDTYLYHALDDFARFIDSQRIHSDSFSRVYKAVLFLSPLSL